MDSHLEKSVIILITILSAQIPFIIDIKTMGVNAINSSIFMVVIALIYVIFVWGMGYIIGGINLRKKDKLDDFPGKVVEYVRIDLEGNK